MKHRSRRFVRVSFESPWIDTSLSSFHQILNFSNEELEEDNWREVLWKTMGKERLCSIVRFNDHGTVREKSLASEVNPVEWKNQQGQIVLPTIGGQPATLMQTKDLQQKVRKVLQQLSDRTGKIASGEIKGKLCTPCLVNCRTGEVVQEPHEYEIENQTEEWYWPISHYYVCREILNTIQTEFQAKLYRTATVYPDGFYWFDDMGEEASLALAWQLTNLVEAAFDAQIPAIKQCLYCEQFFLHATFRQKKFCSKFCHDTYHNKFGRTSTGSSGC